MEGLYVFFFVLGIIAFIGGIFNVRILLDLFTIGNPIEYFFGRNARKIYCIIIGFILVFLAICGFADMLSESNTDFTSFSQELWDKHPRHRYEMISDFEQTHPIDTLTKEKVIDLLGNENMTETSDMYSYYIGGDSILGTYYAIIFDEQGQCINRYMYRD